jgi:hypothetical protein
MNHAARKMPIGPGTVRSIASVIVELFSKFGSATCAPTVERKTTLPGRAVVIALFSASALARVAGKPGAGSKSGGVMRNTPSTSRKAAARAAASSILAIATSQPSAAQGFPLSGSRTTALTA